MADVALGTRLRDADRAQLFLVAALALSVMFVALAVLLNTAIYTGNVATRDSGPRTGEVIEYELAAMEVGEHTIAAVNDKNNSSYSSIRSSFTDTVDAWSEVTSVHPAAELSDAHVTTVATTDGTKVGQNGQDAYTDDNGNANWTVAKDVSARSFRLNVSQPALVNISGTPGLADSFYVGFDDGGEWRAYLYREGGGNVTVEVKDPLGAQVGSVCSVNAGSDDHVLVELSRARVGGEECPALAALFENVTDTYTVTYNNALDGTGSEAINGTFSVVVDSPTGDIVTGADDSSGEPYAAPALYSAELRLTYRSRDAYYRTNIQIAPEEPDV